MRPSGNSSDGMDAGEAFSPRAAEELGEDGFGLIVEGVGGGDGVELAGGHELAEPCDSGDGGRLLQWFRRVCRRRDWRRLRRRCRPGGCGRGGCELGGEVGDEGLVGVGFCAAQAVVEMGGVEDEAEFPAALGEGAQEGDGVGAAGDADGEAQAGRHGAVSSGEDGLGGGGHGKMIRPGG